MKTSMNEKDMKIKNDGITKLGRDKFREKIHLTPLKKWEK